RQRHRTFGKKSSYGQVLPSPQPCNADRAFPPSNHGARPQPVPALKLLTQIEAFGAKLGRSCCSSVGQDSANIDPESGIKGQGYGKQTLIMATTGSRLRFTLLPRPKRDNTFQRPPPKSLVGQGLYSFKWARP